MLLQISNFSRNPLLKSGTSHAPSSSHSCSSKRARVTVSELGCHSVSVNDVADVIHNKVIVSTAVSAAIGQLSKPLTSVLLYGKKFDLKNAVRAGGFPSTHSSAAVATATSLVLERGFSDAIFGLAVVYASLIMYDAQGVRREVGTHAKELNKVLLRKTSYSTSPRDDTDDLTNSISREKPSSSIEMTGSFQKEPVNSSLLLKSNDRFFIRSSSSAVPSGMETEIYGSSQPLKESIGHTEIEVAAGALLGFLVGLAICPYV